MKRNSDHSAPNEGPNSAEDADSTRPPNPTRTHISFDAPPGTSDELPAVIGDYRILGKLGEGGMGVVYEAEQQEPRRKVALKVVRGGAFVDEQRIRMFKREV